MELKWINEEPLYRYFANEKREYFKWGFRKVMSDFYNKYPELEGLCTYYVRELCSKYQDLGTILNEFKVFIN